MPSQTAWGFDPEHREAWRVLWQPTDGTLATRPFPIELDESARFDPVPLAADVELRHVPWESSDVDMVAMSRDQQFAYADLLEAPDGLCHRLLGHPDPLQGDMQLECQLVSNGLYCGNPSGYSDPRAKTLRRGAVEWRLLLQVDSDDDAGMMWGDGGRLFFWITNTALRNRRWDQCWLVLQCG